MDLKQKAKKKSPSSRRRCCILNCKSRSHIGQKRTKITFTRVPDNADKAKKLFKKMNVTIEDIKTSGQKEKRICSEHLVANNPNPEPMETPEEEQNEELEFVPFSFQMEVVVPTHHNEGEFDTFNRAHEQEQEKQKNEEVTSEIAENNEHSYYYEPDIVKFKNLQEHAAKLERKMEELKNSLKCSPHISRANEILKSNHYLNFYTHFKDLKQFDLLVEVIVNHSTKERKLNQRGNISSYECKIDAKVQILMIIIRLRLGLLEDDLAFRFGISQTTVSRIWRYWINVMYSYFIQLPIWPTKEVIRQNMPDCFKAQYSNTRIILDGTEVFIERPSDCVVQSSTYSAYKTHNTARGIIGISPNGFVSFISPLYPGRTPEKQIIIMSGILKKLEPGDSVMADRGFTLAEEIREMDADLNIPPFVDINQNQFSTNDEQTTRDIASVRIHVERAIRNLKIYRILHGTFPNSMADQLNEIWTVCWHLTNFSHIPLLNRKNN